MGSRRSSRGRLTQTARDLSVIQQPDRRARCRSSPTARASRSSASGIPRHESGTVHVASPSELPTSKVWSWGFDRDAHRLAARRSRTIDSAYVELQAGLFRNQETYGLLEPQEPSAFRSTGCRRGTWGVTRATATPCSTPKRSAAPRLELNVTRVLPNARIRLRQGFRVLDVVASLSPRRTWRAELRLAATREPGPRSVELARQRPAVAFRRGLRRADAGRGPARSPARRPVLCAGENEGDWLEIGRDQS